MKQKKRKTKEDEDTEGVPLELQAPQVAGVGLLEPLLLLFSDGALSCAPP